MTQRSEQRARGRPRAFDEAHFLDDVIRLFRAGGFAGVSMSDITAASKLTVGSIYKAYGDKEGVFDAALQRYIALRDADGQRRLAAQPDGRSKLAELLTVYLELSRGADGKLGCMVVSGLADIDLVGRAADRLRQQLGVIEASLQRLIAEGQADGSIPPWVNKEASATVLLAMLQGLRVLGKADLLTTADHQAVKTAMLRIVE